MAPSDADAGAVTQSSGSHYSFNITSPLHSMRLLELPDDLAEYIVRARDTEPVAAESASSLGKTNSARSRVSLKFKSSSSSSSAITVASPTEPNKKDGILHLCSEDKAWAVRQVSTSNSVYVVQSLAFATVSGNDAEQKKWTGRPDEDVEMDRSGAAVDPENHNQATGPERILLKEQDIINNEQNRVRMPQGVLTAVAQASSFLELQAVKFTEEEVDAAVLRVVPLYTVSGEFDQNGYSNANQTDADMDVDTNAIMEEAANARKPAVSMEQILDTIPAPDRMISRACARLCVFEQVQPGNSARTTSCFIPSPRSLLKAWTELMQSCSIESIRLDGNIELARILQVLSDSVDVAIVESMMRIDGMFDSLGLFESTERRMLKPKETSMVIARLILSNVLRGGNNPSEEIRIEDFFKQWADLVPTTFVKHCNLENLEEHRLASRINGEGETVAVKLVTADQAQIIKTMNPIGSKSDVGGGGDSARSTASTSTSAGKRKWHEKFGAQRSLKR